jgi:hypothetical protein
MKKQHYTKVAPELLLLNKPSLLQCAIEGDLGMTKRIC